MHVYNSKHLSSIAVPKGPTLIGPFFLSYLTALSAPRKSKVQIDRAKTRRCLGVPILSFFGIIFGTFFLKKGKELRKLHKSQAETLTFKLLAFRNRFVATVTSEVTCSGIDRTFQLFITESLSQNLRILPQPAQPNAKQNDCNM